MKWALAPNAACGCGSFRKACCSASGLAQALINDPEVVFLDEPMSGLDPLGRRQVRDLILRLRARGCTVFFSSHILSDAEVLCSRVAILAQGKMVASGKLADILAFELKGWELVVANVTDETRVELEKRARQVTPLAHGRFMVDLPAGCGSVAPDARAERPRHRGRVAQSGARNARGLLRANGSRGGAAPDGRGLSVRAMLLVAGAAFKESVRDRVPYTMVIFAVLMMAASYLISQMTAGQDLKIIKDLGLAALSIFGLLIAVFIGIGLVSKEVEKKSVFAPADQAGDAHRSSFSASTSAWSPRWSSTSR